MALSKPNISEKFILLEGHSSKINSGFITPDSKYIVTCAGSGTVGNPDNTIRIWSLITMTQEAILYGHKDRVISLCYNPDSHTIISASYDSKIMFWDFYTRSLSAQICPIPDKHIMCIQLSPKRNFLAISYRNSSIFIWDLKTSIIKATLEVSNINYSGINKMAFSTKNTIFLLVGYNKLAAGNIKTQNVKFFKCPIYGDSSFCLSKDKKSVIFSQKNDLIIWDIQNNISKYKLKEHKYSIISTNILKSNGNIITSSIFATIIWDYESMKKLKMIDHTGNIINISDDSRFLLMSFGKGIRVYDMEMGYNLDMFGVHNWPIYAAIDMPIYDFSITIAFDQILKVWKMPERKLVYEIMYKNECINSICLSKSKNYLILGSNIGKIHVLNNKSIYETIGRGINPCVFKPDPERSENYAPKDIAIEVYEGLVKMKL
ncbi:hypothetical protein SteCoe_9747 [Stentor coeruleus]|uniref:Uncharacterized protein n=1 Tax=Stentor coeruleus TaxID=5963 RepID=A0A1R2CH19_9CILI|nr:hypothetical protein SteCoe_9747 [Stentor coeruleus]